MQSMKLPRILVAIVLVKVKLANQVASPQVLHLQATRLKAPVLLHGPHRCKSLTLKAKKTRLQIKVKVMMKAKILLFFNLHNKGDISRHKTHLVM